MEERPPAELSAPSLASDLQLLSVSVPQSLLEVLVCPACHGTVHLHAVQPQTGQPQMVGLQCVACLRTYPIVDGIPVMLIERATPAA